MSSMEDILKRLHDTVVGFDEEGVKAAAQEVIDGGHDPLQAIMGGLASGMDTVGKLFKSQEYFVPEVLLCAEAMNAGLDLLKPLLPASADNGLGVVVLATVQGDVHDIGKNIVGMMLEIAGFTVHDLGANVPHQKVVDEVTRVGADLLGISAMMTTTMMGMKTLIPMVRGAKPGVGVLIGGAPVTKDIVKMFKADGYAVTAADVVDEAKRVMAAVRA